MEIPLEDEATDILVKALAGSGLSRAALGAQCGLTEGEVDAVVAHPRNSPNVARIAAALGLAPDRLAILARGGYRPAPVTIDGVAGFSTPFGNLLVNAYLVWEPQSGEAAAFDTGGDTDPLREFAAARNLAIRQVFLTHAHGDHVFDLDRLVAKTGAVARTPEAESVEGAEPFAPGRSFAIGGLAVTTRLTRGHSAGGVTYVIKGLSRPVAICGDAVFAGSMGGGKISYREALRTNRDAILSLADDTVLCPGHGPMTTVGEEREHNPFFP